MKRIYLDHNSTTPIRPEVIKIAEPFITNFYGNPSSVHSFGRETREAIENSRIKIASTINASDPNEIFFICTESPCDIGMAFTYATKCFTLPKNF